MPFEFRRQNIEDVILVIPKVFGDTRGFFMECYKKSEFLKNGIMCDFCQDNYSKSSAQLQKSIVRLQIEEFYGLMKVLILIGVLILSQFYQKKIKFNQD